MTYKTKIYPAWLNLFFETACAHCCFKARNAETWPVLLILRQHVCDTWKTLHILNYIISIVYKISYLLGFLLDIKVNVHSDSCRCLLMPITYIDVVYAFYLFKFPEVLRMKCIFLSNKFIDKLCFFQLWWRWKWPHNWRKILKQTSTDRTGSSYISWSVHISSRSKSDFYEYSKIIHSAVK